MLCALLIAMHVGYYWQEVPGKPEWQALMLNGHQVGCLDMENGEYHIRQRNPEGWLGPCEPPIPRPPLNFGIIKDKVEQAEGITRNGKPVDRAELEALLKRKRPLPLVSNAQPVVLPAAICGGVVVVMLAAIALRRRSVKNGS